MNPTKSILISAAIAGLVAGAAAKAQADHHEGKKGAEHKAKKACKTAAAGKTANAASGCNGPNGCGGEKTADGANSCKTANACNTPEAKAKAAKAHAEEKKGH